MMKRKNLTNDEANDEMNNEAKKLN